MQNSLNHWRIFFDSNWTAKVERVQKPSWAARVSPVDHRLYIAVLKLYLKPTWFQQLYRKLYVSYAGDVWKTHVHLDVNFSVFFPVLTKTETYQQILSKLHVRFHVYKLILILLHTERERVKLIGNSVTFSHSCQQLNTQNVH
jgi:hypothetical protein